jgi:regulatory protein
MLVRIDKIEKLPSGKYKLFFENGEKLITYDDVILKNNLLFHKEISDDVYQALMGDTSYYGIYNDCLKYIGKRIRSEKEIREYLMKKELKEDTILKIVSELKKNGFIHDGRFAKAFVSDKIYLSNMGPNRIRKELEELGVSDDIIESSMDEIKSEDVYEHLNKIILKKIKSNHKYSRSILKEKILSSCMDLGYEKSMIVSIFDSLYQEDKDILYKESEKIRNKLSRKYSGDELNYQLVAKLYQKGFLKEEIDKIKESFI